ncbi:uncharacterized protein LOC108851127 isoform X2 [Raphanus sativus]|uniref:Uncharacterized protein LOC108851127 isoform X2 n=1 Tax=Raphanus sativus TaxID=3726 RepID=A0A9W3DGM1_RAPSA|nr:uncharacterized protein LOC108851127 isoform X2 [Raphanus sativus]
MATMEDCKIICSIESIDTDWTWFYQGHGSCKKKVILIKSKSGNLDSTDKPVFWCTNCRINVTVVSPKFKLHLVVKDDTSTCKLMMLDTIAKAIVGCEALELCDGSYDEIEDPEDLPAPMVHQSCLVERYICHVESKRSRRRIAVASLERERRF